MPLSSCDEMWLISVVLYSPPEAKYTVWNYLFVTSVIISLLNMWQTLWTCFWWFLVWHKKSFVVSALRNVNDVLEEFLDLIMTWYCRAFEILLGAQSFGQVPALCRCAFLIFCQVLLGPNENEAQRKLCSFFRENFELPFQILAIQAEVGDREAKKNNVNSLVSWRS